MSFEEFIDCNSKPVQFIRLFIDVLFLGPFLIWLGLRRGGNLSQEVRIVLVATGLGTILFNGLNFIIIERRQ